MFFGNSDPTLLTLSLVAATRQSQDPTFLSEGVKAEVSKHLALPGYSWMGSLFHMLFGRRLAGRRAVRSLHRRRPLHLQQTDFELLAAYPVDRANPPVAQRMRFLKSRQVLLEARLQANSIHIRQKQGTMPSEVLNLDLECLALLCANPSPKQTAPDFEITRLCQELKRTAGQEANTILAKKN